MYGIYKEIFISMKNIRYEMSSVEFLDGIYTLNFALFKFKISKYVYIGLKIYIIYMYVFIYILYILV